MSRVILASASPRRSDFLKYLITDFEIIPADVDETPLEGEAPADLVKRLATLKAQTVSKLYPDAIVIAADTIVAIDQEILGKPADAEEARRFLNRLSGQVHQVITAHVVIQQSIEKTRAACTSTNVYFNEISTKSLDKYLATSEPYDKAGAYALQGRAAQFIKSIKGSHTAVIGLDLAQLKIDLNDFISLE